MDTFFLSHGAVTLTVDETVPARSFFKSWLPAAMAGKQAPRAILMVSGHWDTATPTVNVVHGTNDTIYDFHGFPEAMYKVGLISHQHVYLLTASVSRTQSDMVQSQLYAAEVPCSGCA
jgi:aromatic ring-opening dioxygenase catalytic subunit (LigB family)